MACSYFLKDGYPVESLKQYLFTIANSNYEEWQIAHPDKGTEDFVFSFDKMSLDGALFDIDKLKFFSKEYLSRLSGADTKDFVKDYASKYNPELYDLIVSDEAYFVEIMNIEKDRENPRKDYEKCGDILEKVKFFYPKYFDEIFAGGLIYNAAIDRKVIVDVLNDFADTLNYLVSEQEWFANLKQLGVRHGFAESNKIYKADKASYLGSINDVAEMVRIALTGSRQSPNLYYILNVLKEAEIKRRIALSVNLLRR